MSNRPATVKEYVETVPDVGRERVVALRSLLQEALPQATEALKWGNPAFVHPDGTILLVMSAHAQHANVVFTPSTRKAFAADLTGLDTGKGSVKLPYTDPVPDDLLRRMVAYRLREHEEDGVGWM